MKQILNLAPVRAVEEEQKKFWNFKNVDDDTGELTIYGEIASESWWGDEVTPKNFKTDLDALGDVSTINVFINSPGGSVFAGQAIHSILKRHKATVNVYIDGLAASIASVIAMAGDVITMPKNAMMMIHKPWACACGDSDEFLEMAERLDNIEGTIIEAYMKKATISEEDVKELVAAETWLSAVDAKEYGFIDIIEDEKQVAACVTNIIDEYKNTPESIKKMATNQIENDNDTEAELELLRAKLKLECEL